MSQAIAHQSPSDADELDAAADQAIEACGGDVRNALKALIVANDFLETELSALQIGEGECPIN
jgi:hypothetical protein